MQDYNYWKHGCMEVTVEVSCCKYPSASNLDEIWLENKQSLVEYLKQANTGVRGIVRFENGQQVGNLTIKIDERQPYFKTNKNGEYYRILLPGSYKMSLMFECESVFETSIQISAVTNLLELNVTLSNDLYQAYLSKSLNRYSVFCASGSLSTNSSRGSTKPTPGINNIGGIENGSQSGSLINCSNKFKFDLCKLIFMKLLVFYFVKN